MSVTPVTVVSMPFLRGIQRGAPGGVFASPRSALFLDGLSARDAIRRSWERPPRPRAGRTDLTRPWRPRPRRPRRSSAVGGAAAWLRHERPPVGGLWQRQAWEG